ncbi:MAG: endopeptidase La [Longimicrobiales bacterium]|nr:endopeptidase La [Longimicrobiales bacterium]
MATLTRVDDVVEVPDRLPVVALRDLVFFPYIVLPILIGRRRSVAALEEAQASDSLVLLVAQKDPGVDDPGSEDLFRVGTVARVVQVTRLPDGTSRVVLEGLGRARLKRLTTTTEALRATVELFVPREAEDPANAAATGVAEGADAVGEGATAAVRERPTQKANADGSLVDDSALPDDADARAAAEAHGDTTAPYESDSDEDRFLVPESDAAPRSLESLTTSVRQLYAEYARMHERIPEELSEMPSPGGDRVRFAHLVAGHLILPSLEKQELLEAASPREQLSVLREMLIRELEILRIERKLDRQIQLQLGGRDSPFDLSPRPSGGGRRKQAKEEPEEWEEIAEQIRRSDLPDHARARAEKELTRLRKLNPVAPEAAVIRTHLDWILALPWTGRSEDNLDVKHASEILEAEHFGLGEVKERVLDHVAVLSLVQEMRGPILCLVGPPGVGKTSLGRSIAGALGREFVRVSLGGVRDEAEIRGHRRTYVGALPGRVIQGMRRSGTKNPVFLLDEIDKLARDFHGDPGAALLEVLDPEQNKTFTDHYLELEYDLSDVLFVATANTLQGVPEPLRDRMEVIRLPGYLDTEKREIAERFLWPRQAEQHGLQDGSVRLSADAVHEIIERYTREAGVRELNRRLSRVARKLARQVAEESEISEGEARVVEAADLKELLGPPPYQPPDRDEDGDRVGIANGLAWTAAGGEVMDVEVAIVPGAGNLRLTGTLGDVMKESAQAAVTYARSRSALLGLDPHFHEKIDVHIHIPEGATPKDGPSAGITIAVALISALTDTPTRADVAMTGEITLRGRVIGVGGVKEKAVAALRTGMSRVVLPHANATDLETLPDEVREALTFDLVTTMDEVMDAVLARAPGQRRTSADAGLGVPLPHG